MTDAPPLRTTWAVVALTCVASLGVLIATGGNLGLAVAPPAAAGLLYLVWRLPLRYTGGALFFMLVAGERLDDVANLFHTPLLPLSLAVTTKLSVLTNVKPLQFSGGDLLCALLLVIAVARAGKPETEGPRIQAARPLALCAGLFAAAVALEFARGMRQNGDVTIGLWQLRTLWHIPFYFIVFQLCVRGPQDFVFVGRLVVLAAAARGALAAVVRAFVEFPARLRPLEFVTSHDDSMTFSLGLVVLLVAVSERTDRRTVLRCLLFAPIILWGMVVNARRLAWVDLAAAMLTYALMSQRTPLKRAVERAIVALIPVVILYVAVGWNASSRIFGPVRLVKSVVSSQSDRSTLDRDVENWNLATSVATNPLFGRGLGQPYDELVPMDDISAYFPMYRGLPHNSVLGLWVFFGGVGIAMLWPLLIAGLYMGARGYRASVQPEQRTAAFAAVATLIIFLNQSYGDMAFWSDIGPALVGMALAVAGKAAVASGGWPVQPLKSAYAAAVAREAAAQPWRKPAGTMAAG